MRTRIGLVRKCARPRCICVRCCWCSPVRTLMVRLLLANTGRERPHSFTRHRRHVAFFHRCISFEMHACALHANCDVNRQTEACRRAAALRSNKLVFWPDKRGHLVVTSFWEFTIIVHYLFYGHMVMLHCYYWPVWIVRCIKMQVEYNVIDINHNCHRGNAASLYAHLILPFVDL